MYDGYSIVYVVIVNYSILCYTCLTCECVYIYIYICAVPPRARPRSREIAALAGARPRLPTADTRARTRTLLPGHVRTC